MYSRTEQSPNMDQKTLTWMTWTNDKQETGNDFPCFTQNTQLALRSALYTLEDRWIECQLSAKISRAKCLFWQHKHLQLVKAKIPPFIAATLPSVSMANWIRDEFWLIRFAGAMKQAPSALPWRERFKVLVSLYTATKLHLKLQSSERWQDSPITWSLQFILWEDMNVWQSIHWFSFCFVWV